METIIILKMLKFVVLFLLGGIMVAKSEEVIDIITWKEFFTC